MVRTPHSELGIKCGYNITILDMPDQPQLTSKELQSFIKKQDESFAEIEKADLLEKQMENTYCRKVEITWTITTVTTRRNNSPITYTDNHHVTGYVLGTVKNNNNLLPIYEEDGTVEVLEKSDITDIKDIDPSSKIPNELLLQKIQEWNGTGKHKLQIEAADNIKIATTYYKHSNNTIEKIECDDHDTCTRTRVNEKEVPGDATYITQTEFRSLFYPKHLHRKYYKNSNQTIFEISCKNEYQKGSCTKKKITGIPPGKPTISKEEFLSYFPKVKKGGSLHSNKINKSKSTKKQTKKSRSYKKRTIKKH